MEFLMQPFGRSALLEEVGESFVPGPQVGNGGLLAETVVLPQQHGPAASGEPQIWSAKKDGVARRESSPLTSELSTGKMYPQAPGWNKRLRIGVFEKVVRC